MSSQFSHTSNHSKQIERDQNRGRGRPKSTTTLRKIQEALTLLSSKVQTLETAVTQHNLNPQPESLSTSFNDFRIDNTPNNNQPSGRDNTFMLEQLVKIQEDNHFLQITQLIGKLSGRESSQELTNYFHTFESFTSNYTNEKRVALLVAKLDNKAFHIYNTLNQEQRQKSIQIGSRSKPNYSPVFSAAQRNH